LSAFGFIGGEFAGRVEGEEAASQALEGIESDFAGLGKFLVEQPTFLK
jgi:hypothetical protein